MFLTIAFLIGFGAMETSAQFEIKIPQFGKPKAERPKTGDTNAPTNNSDNNQNKPTKSKGDVGFMAKPRPTSVPVLLKDTVEIKAVRNNTYWKFPKERDYSSWMPVINFDVFHDRSETVRYTIEWFNPDGSLWFSDAIDGTQSRFSIEVMNTKATAAAGTYGFRLLNTKSKETVFQGKFNVKKIDLSNGDPRQKNSATFYVDQDWSLPIGYIGFNDNTSWDHDPTPTVYLWFKGELKREDFEARLFHNNQQIASTDDGGMVYDGDAKRNSDSCFEQRETCLYRLWQFSWNLRVESFNQAATVGSYARYPKMLYTKDAPGEYTVKVFHKGVQVRETKFTVQPNGWLETNKFAAQLPMKNYLALIPVKVMGTLDKWNPAAWKTAAFYGNPLTGFIAP